MRRKGRGRRLRETCRGILKKMEDREEAAEDLDEYDVLAEKQRLKAALHHSVGKVCAEVEDTDFSREVIAAVTEAAFNQSQLLAWDTEAFAKHAKRTVIAPEDIRLCCRRNDDLLTYITEQVEKLKADRETRRTTSTATSGDRDDLATAGPRNRQTTKKRRVETETQSSEKLNH